MVGFGMDEWLVDGLVELGDIYKKGYGATVTEVTKATGTPPRTLEQFVCDHRGAFG